MFIFDVDQPQVVYTAEDIGRGYTAGDVCKGLISRIDLRTNIVETIFSTEYLNFNMQNSLSETMTSVKALSQSDVLGGSQLLIGGSRSFSLGLLDIRCLSPSPARGNTGSEVAGSQFVKTWEPLRHRHLQRKKSAHEACEVSVSGLCFSANGASILASYQGDQIYIFDTYGEGTSDILEESSSSAESIILETSTSTSTSTASTPATSTTKTPKIGPKSLLGGHVNHATFLKSVAFFGPKDEFVVSGSDSGHIWIWDAKSGNLDIDEPHDRTCRVINFLKAGMLTICTIM
jgi:WD40 repeat protein